MSPIVFVFFTFGLFLTANSQRRPRGQPFIDPPPELIKSPYLDMGSMGMLEDNRYIYLEGAQPMRGRMELCFIEIGTAFFIGGAIGGFRGFLQARDLARGYPPALYRTILFNHIVKASTLGNTLGTLTLLFSGSGTLISHFRGREDALNNISASTVTGLLFQSSGGIRKMFLGGLAGFALGSLMSLWNERHFLKSFWAVRTQPFYPLPETSSNEDSTELS